MKNQTAGEKVWKQLLFFAIPIWLGTFFQQLYNTADAVIVGNFVGKGALAAVGATGVISGLLIGFFVGISTGAGVVVSQFYGSGDVRGVSDAVHNSIAFGLAGGFVIMILGLSTADICLHVINTPKDIFDDAKLYLQICYLGMIPLSVHNMGISVLRAVGDSRHPLYFLIAASLTNIVLDFVFVLFLDMGVLGVAVATVISQVVAAVLTMITLMRTQGCCHFEWRSLRFDRPIIKKILQIGLPAGLQSVLYSFSNIVVQSSVNVFGTNVVAAMTAYSKIDAFFWMTLMAFSAAVTTFVGQNFGARDYDRMKKYIHQGLVLSAIATAFLLAVLLPFSSYVYRFFVEDAEVIELGTKVLFFLGPAWPTYICLEIFSAGMRGTGDSFIPTIITCVGICVLRVVWIWGVAEHLWHTLYGVLACYPITWTLTSLLFLVYYLRGNWLRRRIQIQEKESGAYSGQNEKN